MTQRPTELEDNLRAWRRILAVAFATYVAVAGIAFSADAPRAGLVMLAAGAIEMPLVWRVVRVAAASR
jgi:hypothetical protein